MVTVGYSGSDNSDSHIMARDMVARSGLKESELVRMPSVTDVVRAMEAKDVDYGVLPFRNNDGAIPETAEATDGKPCLFLGTSWCLMPRSLYARAGERIRTVLSDAETIELCQTTISRVCPGAEVRESADPFSELGAGCAVVCRKEEGEAAGLDLVEEDMRDSALKMTQYVLAKLV